MNRIPVIALNRLDARLAFKCFGGVLVFILLFAARAGFGQSNLDDFAAREQVLIDAIDAEQAQNGPYSEALIAHLTELSEVYEDIGAFEPAQEAISRVLTVIRANNGLESLDQAPFIRRLITRERERGNAEAAWELGQELLGLATRNPNDLRSAGIFRETGDMLMGVLARYDAGEFPAEIVLGCFYDDTLVQQQARFRGSQPMQAVKSLDPLRSLETDARECGAGSRKQARRALAESAQWYYIETINSLRRNGAPESTEIPELLDELVHSSYWFTNPSLGASGLDGIVEYLDENSVAWLPKIEARVQAADWDLLYASDLGTRYVDSAHEIYQQTHELALANGVEQAAIDAIFSPAIPVMLPSFIDNPLITEQTALSEGYIDVSFVVTEDGKGKQIEVLEVSPELPRAARKDLVRLIKYSRFRPQMVDGRIMDSAPIVVRYYVND